MRSDRAALWGLNCCCERGRRLQKSAWSQTRKTISPALTGELKRKDEHEPRLTTCQPAFMCFYSEGPNCFSSVQRSSENPLHAIVQPPSPSSCELLVHGGCTWSRRALKGSAVGPPVFLHSQFNLSSNLHQRLVQSRSWMQHCLPEAKCTNYSFIQADLQLVISLHPFDFAGTAVYCVQKNNRHKTNCTIWYQLENETRQRSVGKPRSEGIKPLQTGRGRAKPNPGQSPAAAAEVSAEAPKLCWLQKRVSQG